MTLLANLTCPLVWGCSIDDTQCVITKPLHKLIQPFVYKLQFITYYDSVRNAESGDHVLPLKKFHIGSRDNGSRFSFYPFREVVDCH